MIFHKIEQDNCFIIQQIVSETDFAARKAVVVQWFARFQSNLGNLRISQDICYVRMTDNNDFLTVYGHRANLLNNSIKYLYICFMHYLYSLKQSWIIKDNTL